ncbi:hypothetical protein HL653_14975 [Sphingomonas sp. AP4-R1]|uniref:hypothetical protein n=1 Tax=Sphingomonas sp. AP4-R1 TaxID=2735134 RepID=UPI0014936A06|nr:hypothetical protein [Sphingomonas sp. AP4-R1]QJU56371.1 hypothetical protein HL653_14975 [Sphingomonas sp. AP4-R1]
MFFYQNEYGSRVFFDDLGPPWPKHPCTDNEPDPIGRPGVSVGQSIPVAKGPGISVVIRRLASDALVEESEVDDDYSPPLRTGHGWDRCVVRKRSDREGLAYFIVYNASDPANRSIRFSTSSRPDLPSSEETLYLSGNRMSFFSFADFVPQEVSIERKSTKAVSSSKKRAARRRKARRKRK